MCSKRTVYKENFPENTYLEFESINNGFPAEKK